MEFQCELSFNHSQSSVVQSSENSMSDDNNTLNINVENDASRDQIPVGEISIIEIKEEDEEEYDVPMVYTSADQLIYVRTKSPKRSKIQKDPKKVENIKLKKDGNTTEVNATDGKPSTMTSTPIQRSHKELNEMSQSTNNTGTNVGKRLYACKYCPKRFSHKQNRNMHILTHKENVFCCSGCFREFSQNTEKEAHENECKSRRFECYLCNRDENKKPYVTINKGKIIRHFITHTSDKQFSCEFCSKQFRQKSGLTAHRRIHTKEKPYQCKICSKRFRFVSNRSRHTKIHFK